MNFNKVILAGNLTRDPETRYSAGGTAIVNCSLAINANWTGKDGARKQDTTFIEFTAFGRTGEVLAQHLGKGDPLHLEGRLRLDQWEDRQTGETRQRLKVVADTIQFVGPPRPRNGGPDTSAQAPQAAMTTATSAKKKGSRSGPPGLDYDEDDVPF